MSVPELSIQIKNTPGQLVQITAILAEANINIRAITASSTGKTGWVRVVVDNAKMAEEALEDCGFSVDTGEALAILLPDEPGALDRALRALSEEKINVDYIYTSSGAQPDRQTVIVGVQSPSKAGKLMSKYGIQLANLPS